MKTIEERAKEHADRHKKQEIAFFGENKRYPYIRVYNVELASYVNGAKEQREIDVMRVRQFLERESAYNGSMTCIDDSLIEELCKAMEE